MLSFGGLLAVGGPDSWEPPLPPQPWKTTSKKSTTPSLSVSKSL
jgi:hypothetical protein